jgi:hypothetical protein|tara:strand:- start:2844 stop:3212 length:369 start_codon:yes stop_codon:yes gene_type:complete
MEKNNLKNKEEYLLPKEVLTHVNTLIGKGDNTLSTVIETDFYTDESLKRLLEKNNLMWSHKKFDGFNVSLNEGLINFTNTLTYLYFIKRKDENTYKFYTICKESSSDSMIFFLQSYKKFKTI